MKEKNYGFTIYGNPERIRIFLKEIKRFLEREEDGLYRAIYTLLDNKGKAAFQSNQIETLLRSDFNKIDGALDKEGKVTLSITKEPRVIEYAKELVEKKSGYPESRKFHLQETTIQRKRRR